MPEAIRNDSFKLPIEKKINYGHIILRKNIIENENPFLNQILITQDNHLNISDSPSNLGNFIANSKLYNSISDGDIGLVNNKGILRVILSKQANHNTLLITERCDNRCLFCSQPPKEWNDEWLLTQAALAIAAFQSYQPIGITGGEPLLYKDAFLRFLDILSEYAPTTPLHILTNGRAFSDQLFTTAIAMYCKNLSLTFGIPLYSAISSHHNRLVGAPNAYTETTKGLINAGNCGIPIELRIIPTAQNLKDISATIEFATRCLSSVVQVSIMNLEPAGWAKKNWRELYTPPEAYEMELYDAVETARSAHLPVYLFNYPLCHLSERLQPYAVKSISDWKNYFPNECKGCFKIKNCSGYFVSSKGIYHQSPRRFI